MTIFTMVAFWNDWFTALIYMNDKSKYPLQLVLRQILIQSQASANGACGIVDNPPAATIDTTGAGDIFGGSALSRLLMLNKPLNTLTDEELRNAATFACWAASLSTERAGGISSVPSLDMILSRING